MATGVSAKWAISDNTVIGARRWRASVIIRMEWLCILARLSMVESCIPVILFLRNDEHQ